MSNNKIIVIRWKCLDRTAARYCSNLLQAVEDANPQINELLKSELYSNRATLGFLILPLHTLYYKITLICQMKKLNAQTYLSIFI
jgi:hypothetical protein